MSELEPIKSPCYGVCTLDSNRICIGCKRSQDEIKEWRNASNSRRLEILKNCKLRIIKHPTIRTPIQGM